MEYLCSPYQVHRSRSFKFGRSWSRIAGDARNCPRQQSIQQHRSKACISHVDATTYIQCTVQLVFVMTHKTLLYRVSSLSQVIRCPLSGTSTEYLFEDWQLPLIRRRRRSRTPEQVQWTRKNLREAWWNEPHPG